MHFDTDRMRGVTWGLDENTIYLTWIYKAEGALRRRPRHRTRRWQWIRDGKVEMRTLVNETRVVD
ncbi:hypothetical protein ACU686_11035 [Yinghuangia aomiensis]